VKAIQSRAGDALPELGVDGRAPSLNWLGAEQLAGLAHDMRGPLASITTSAELLELEPGGSESAHLIAVIQRQALRLSQMIQDLVECLRSPEEAINLHAESVDLSQLVTEVAAEFQIIARSHSLVTEVERPEVMTRLDVDKVKRILQNLLCNAQQYSPIATTIWLRVSVQENASQAVIQVEDEGPGIPEFAREKIFEPFVRLEKGCGQGLGLYIVNRLAKAHGGSAWVEAGRIGARFCVSLPALPQAPQETSGSQAPHSRTVRTHRESVRRTNSLT
jgi:signal transduction histidine kinase